MRRPRLSARARANRMNAKRSTGPKTPRGKARVSGNALLHGLRSATAPRPLPEEVDALAQRLLEDARGEIGAKGAGLEEAARRLAAAQAHLLGIRNIRRRYWRRLFDDTPERDADFELLFNEAKRFDAPRMLLHAQRLRAQAARRQDPLRNLDALERHERRALARRKWAARDFAEALAAPHGLASHVSRDPEA